MTDEELELVSKICLTADGWCSSCQANLFDQLKEAFPDKVAIIDAVMGRAEYIHDQYRAQERAFWDSMDAPKPSVQRCK